MNLTKAHKKKSGGGWIKRGKLYQVHCQIHYDEWADNYYYILELDGIKKNSLWENKTYSTEEECVKACEVWCLKNGRRYRF